jgi:hypothetical protein
VHRDLMAVEALNSHNSIGCDGLRRRRKRSTLGGARVEGMPAASIRTSPASPVAWTDRTALGPCVAAVISID